MSTTEERHGIALVIMDDFARRTGLCSDLPPRRYLWTDAFAVCNYVGLHYAIGERRLLESAVELVHQVHRVLGRHREDDARDGWISGLSEEEGIRHPTAGGLRIGKPMPERGPRERWDPREEWDRDGQYYHYLTKWIRALERVSVATREPSYRRWAEELALAMDRGFAARGPSGGGLHWKMSIDLSRPLVPSMGLHDPLDGFLTLRSLRAHRTRAQEGGLDSALGRLSALCRDRDWASDDPLGVGGLLVAAHDCRGLVSAGEHDLREFCASLESDAERSLQALGELAFLSLAAERRLGFRELGLSLGLASVAHSGPARSGGLLSRYIPVRKAIEGFWLRAENRSAETWTAHRDISEVMLATSLAPEGFLRGGQA